MLFEGDFPRAWALLLQHIESSALSPSKEVSLNALKSFQEVLQLKPPKKLNLVKQSSTTSSSSEKHTDDTALSVDDLVVPAEEAISRSENMVSAAEEVSSERTSVSDLIDLENDEADRIDSDVLWSNAWRVWYSIGIASTKPPQERTANLPSQAFLTALVKIFPLLFKHIRLRFVSSDLHKFFLVLQNAVSVPVQADMSVFILPSAGDNELTPLQEAILHSIRILQGVSLTLCLHHYEMPPPPPDEVIVNVDMQNTIESLVLKFCHDFIPAGHQRWYEANAVHVSRHIRSTLDIRHLLLSSALIWSDRNQSNIQGVIQTGEI